MKQICNVQCLKSTAATNFCHSSRSCAHVNHSVFQTTCRVLSTNPILLLIAVSSESMARFTSPPLPLLCNIVCPQLSSWPPLFLGLSIQANASLLHSRLCGILATCPSHPSALRAYMVSTDVIPPSCSARSLADRRCLHVCHRVTPHMDLTHRRWNLTSLERAFSVCSLPINVSFFRLSCLSSLVVSTHSLLMHSDVLISHHITTHYPDSSTHSPLTT